MVELGDGTVVQDGMRYNERARYPSDKISYIPYPVIAQIVAVYEIDVVDNRDGETTVCDLHVTSMGIDLFKVPWSMSRASMENYLHVGVPKAATKNVDGSQFNPGLMDPAKTDGDSVIVQFIGGDVHQPIITGMAPQIQSGFDGASPDPRPYIDDGDSFKVRWNGTVFLIDKDGNVEFSTSKPSLDETITKNKKFSIKLGDPDEDQVVELTVDDTSGAPVISLKVTDDSGNINEIAVDKNGVTVTTHGTTTVNSTGDVSVTSSGKATINSTGDAKVQSAGKIDVIASGIATVTASEVHVNGTAGHVLTDLTDPVVDTIFGTATVGVPTVKSG